MSTNSLEIVGYFSYDCQPDGYCTYGCGKRPDTICIGCAEHTAWLEPDTVPANLHPLYEREDGQPVDYCDGCGEPFPYL